MTIVKHKDSKRTKTSKAPLTPRERPVEYLTLTRYVPRCIVCMEPREARAYPVCPKCSGRHR
jgi:hypothetical protein